MNSRKKSQKDKVVIPTDQSAMVQYIKVPYNLFFYIFVFLILSAGYLYVFLFSLLKIPFSFLKSCYKIRNIPTYFITAFLNYLFSRILLICSTPFAAASSGVLSSYITLSIIVLKAAPISASVVSPIS